MKLKLLFILIICSSILPFRGMSQLTDPPPPPPDPVDVPFDGGLSILLATGVAYGIKKVRDSRKKNKDQHMI